MNTVKMNEEKRKEALAKYLECDIEDLEEEGYRDNAFEYGREEYLILTDEEADQEAREDIESSLWAFNADFIIRHSALPWEATEMIKSFQENKCEDANETIRALIDSTGDMDRFVEDAINADGRGHFMSTYDGEENEVIVKLGAFEVFLYIYRVN